MQTTSRRDCLKTAAAMMILPSGLARGYAANNKLDIGVIGVGGIGGFNAKALAQFGENVRALCDVDPKRLAEQAALHPKARTYADFRQMLAKEKLDGVVVATPDHTHAYISILAMKEGLHVFCQKPLAQTVQEARVMTEVAAQRGVITQMGTSTTSSKQNMRTVEMIQSGALGEITEVHAWTDRPCWPQGFMRPSGEQAVPEGLDWDAWIGPARMRPYLAKWPTEDPAYRIPERLLRVHPDWWKPESYWNSVYHPFSWRGWSEFGTGSLGDLAAHTLNVVFWALDLGAPAAADVVEMSGPAGDMFPTWSVVRFDFARRGVHPPLKVFWYDGGQLPAPEIIGNGSPNGGVVFIGTKGSLPAGRGRFHGQKVEPYPVPPQRQWDREDVHTDWTRGIRTGKQPGCHFGYSGPFTEAYLLGNIALRVGHRVEWNPESFRITNCTEANQYLARDARKGWELPV